MEPSTSEELQVDDEMIAIIEKSLVAELEKETTDQPQGDHDELAIINGKKKRKELHVPPYTPTVGMISVYVGKIGRETTLDQMVDFFTRQNVAVHNPYLQNRRRCSFGFVEVKTQEDYEKLKRIDKEWNGHTLELKLNDKVHKGEVNILETPRLISLYVTNIHVDTTWQELSDFLKTLDINVHNVKMPNKRWIKGGRETMHGYIVVESGDFERLQAVDKELNGYKLIFSLNPNSRGPPPSVKADVQGETTEGPPTKKQKQESMPADVITVIVRVSKGTNYQQYLDLINTLNVKVYNPKLKNSKGTKTKGKNGEIDVESEEDCEKLQKINRELNGEKVTFKRKPKTRFFE